jgi:hypothetical protein
VLTQPGAEHRCASDDFGAKYYECSSMQQAVLRPVRHGLQVLLVQAIILQLVRCWYQAACKCMCNPVGGYVR